MEEIPHLHDEGVVFTFAKYLPTRSRVCKDMFLAILLWRLFRWVELESLFSPQQPYLSYHHAQLLDTLFEHAREPLGSSTKLRPTPILWHPNPQTISKPFDKWFKSTRKLHQFVLLASAIVLTSRVEYR